MTIKEVEKRTGISKRMIRYYEEFGLISPDRSETNYRVYSETDTNQLICINSLSELGFSLNEISEIIVKNKSKEIFKSHLTQLLEKQRSSFNENRINVNRIKNLMQSLDSDSAEILDKILLAKLPTADLKSEFTLEKFIGTHHVVKDRIQPIHDFAEKIESMSNGELTVSEITYITYRGVFENNLFESASISMCTQLYSHFLFFSKSSDKFNERFHRSLADLFTECWSAVSWPLNLEFRAITNDVATLETLFSPIDLCILLDLKNNLGDSLQMVIPGQQLVMFLSERSGVAANASRPSPN